MSESILKLVADEPEAEAYRLQDQIGFILRRAHQRHVAIFAQQIADFTPPQFAALAMLASRGQMTQSELGTATAMDAATIKGVVDRLAARDLVHIEGHEADRRKLAVSLTAEGRAAVASLLPAAKRVTGDTLAPLTAKEAKVLAGLLMKIA